MNENSRPYEAEIQRHKALRQQNNWLFSSLLIPIGLYLLTQWDGLMILAIIWLAAVCVFTKRQQKALMERYQQIEQERVERLRTALAQKGISEQAFRSSTFAYRRRENSFVPVFLFSENGTRYTLENPFLKNCLYTVQDTMLYLFDLNEQALEAAPQELTSAATEWKPEPRFHLVLLQQESNRLQEFLVMESFIYPVIWEQMKANKPKDLFHSKYEISLLKKEKLCSFCSDAEPDTVYYLPERFKKILESGER